MIKLLSVDFRRCYKTKRFVIGTLIPVCIILLIIYIALTHDNDGHVDNLPFTVISFFPSIIAIIGGLYISQDYTNNTIRNKIIFGHSRTKIYMSNWITSMLGTVILYGVYIFACYGIGGIAMGFSSSFDAAFSFKCILLAYCPMLSYTALTVLVCMICQKTRGTVLSFMLYYIMGMSSILEYFIDNETFSKIFNNCNPAIQFDSVQYYAVDPSMLGDNIEISWIPISTAVIILLSTLGGIAIFNKQDIK